MTWAVLAGHPWAKATLPSDDELPRSHQTLTGDWRTSYAVTGTADPVGFTADDFDDSLWRRVDVPHNWDTYQGYRQAKHGQLHGTAWYRRTFTLDRDTLHAVSLGQRRVFLLFEGVGSYATVWVNGHEVGRHAGGLTTFTLDITEALARGSDDLNRLAVRAEHPPGIRDLPWVCGGCERAYGFSEGSQPFGIFRPVHVVVTDALRIAPFGVHVWNDRSVSPDAATAHVRTEITNHGRTTRGFVVRTTLSSPDGHVVAVANSPSIELAAGATLVTEPQLLTAAPATLWSVGNPTLYSIRSELLATAPNESASRVLDRVETPFGFRWIDWPHGNDQSRGTFLVNGQPVFLNGTCEYPHLLGGNHAFTAAQIDARVRQIEAAGFNAFRDAHHPHDLRYNQHWDRDGVAWWTQFGAHIWFDREDFRANYLALLRDWVKERRNSPSLVLWGLQNESQLPRDFAAECTALIRELDPTARDQRLVTTCNGGEGTDWNVPQNWTGTYGGDPLTYADDLRKQILVGEYGAWRSADLAPPMDGSPPRGYDEAAFTALLETKVRLADAARGASAGHFQWIFSTHDNPGRNFGSKGEQLADGWSFLDRVGPANNKGLLTSWGEPLDAYYMYRANFADPAREPTVVIAGASWPDRFTPAGGPSVQEIIVYSNCDDVELFNGPECLGTRTRSGLGTHIQWRASTIKFRDLRAIARRNGKVVATDVIELPHLPGLKEPAADAAQRSVSPESGDTWKTLYRVNCGGPAYEDDEGHEWLADHDFREGDHWGALSWAQEYPHLPPALGSIRRVYVPIAGTRDEALYQTFRYGREKLRYRFALPDGEYRVELHFAEPWYGRGQVDATGWRIFDVALNGTTVLSNVDLFHEAGYAGALRKVVTAHVSGGWLELSFPRVTSYQAVISAIAIATRNAELRTAPNRDDAVRDITPDGTRLEAWLNSGDRAFIDAPDTLATLPEFARHQLWLRRPRSARESPLSFLTAAESDIYVATGARPTAVPDRADTGETITIVGAATATRVPLTRLHARAGERVTLAAAEFAIVVPTRPLAPAQTISSLAVVPASVSSGWQTAGHLQAGFRPQGADGPAFTTLPADLTDSDWLVTPTVVAATDLRVRLLVTEEVEITLGLDARLVAAPAWLRDWRLVDGSLALDGRALTLHRRRFPAGATVELGANGVLANGEPATMYTVIVRPVRPATVYATATPALTGASPVSTWKIDVGVGDRYTFVMALRPAASSATRVRYEFLEGNGSRVLCTEERDLGSLPAESDGWIRWRVRTCTSVNAGTYEVRLTHLSGPPLPLGPLTVE